MIIGRLSRRCKHNYDLQAQLATFQVGDGSPTDFDDASDDDDDFDDNSDDGAVHLG